MGAFKPLLPFGDSTVVETCIGSLTDAGVGTIVLVLGTQAGQMRRRLAHLPLRFAFNPDESSEMGASIACGLEQVPKDAEAIFVALCDQPAVPPEVIGLLIEERLQTGARLIVPEHEGRGGHPVLLDGALREELRGLDQQRGLRALFDAHRGEVRRVPVSSPYIARDMDTWDDYRALYLELFGVEPPGQQP